MNYLEGRLMVNLIESLGINSPSFQQGCRDSNDAVIEF